MIGVLAQDPRGELLAHAHAGAIHRDVVDDRVGSREVDVFEDAGRVAHGCDALLGMQPALLVDEHRFARGDVAHQLERQHIERDALGGQHVFGAARRAPLAEHQRPDAVRIAKAQDPVTDDHGHDCVTATAPAIHCARSSEDVGRRHARGAHALQFRGKHVQQHLGIGLAVQVTPILTDQHLGELGGIGQVAVVREADAVGRVHVERLRLGSAVTAGGRVAHVADTLITQQARACAVARTRRAPGPRPCASTAGLRMRS